MSDRYGFPTEKCRKCKGTGEWMNGGAEFVRCYTCKGTGTVIAAIARRAHAEFLEAKKIAGLRRVDEMKEGDTMMYAPIAGYAKRRFVIEKIAHDTLNKGHMVLILRGLDFRLGFHSGSIIEVPVPDFDPAPFLAMIPETK